MSGILWLAIRRLIGPQSTSHEIVSSLGLRQSSLDEACQPVIRTFCSKLTVLQRLLNLDKSLVDIQETANRFSNAQLRQAELQIRHNDVILNQMQSARGVLDDVVSSAATLAHIAFAFAWIRPLSLICFPLLVLSCFKRRYALFAGLGFGTSTFAILGQSADRYAQLSDLLFLTF